MFYPNSQNTTSYTHTEQLKNKEKMLETFESNDAKK
jgi:hypothetical protein